MQASTAQRNNYNKLKRYVTIEQPAQVKRGIKATIKKYKGKRYDCQPLSDSSIKKLYARFNVNYSKTSEKDKYVIYDATYATECYLHAKIENDKYLNDGIIGGVMKYYGGKYINTAGES